MLKEITNISGDSKKNLLQAQDKIAQALQKLAKEKFTGQVIIKLAMNQGGIRDSKIILETKL